MRRTLNYRITEENNGHTIKQFLKAKGYSSQSMIRLKKEPGFVLVNDEPAFMTYRLRQGDLLTIHIVESASSEKILPVKLPLTILYEDEDLMIIDKPAGMPIHPSMNNYDNSVANALAWYFQQQQTPFVFRCINRLDRDTSGLTVIARHYVSAGILSAMAMPNSNQPHTAYAEENPGSASHIAVPNSRLLRREYLAIVRGSVVPPAGVIHAPLGRKPGSIIERVVDFEKGEPAVTHYRVVTEKNGYSLVSLLLETGRTHQIRIHMKYLGYPLIGDYLYNPDMERIGRQALHSFRLSFPHPITGENMTFTSPLPEDMRMVLDM